MMGFPVTAWNTHKAINLDVPVSYSDDTEDIHALAQNVLNISYRLPQDMPLPRRVIELDVVEHSFDIMDNILIRNDRSLVKLIEEAYISACRSREKRFGECIVLGWTVCEQLISICWRNLIDNSQSTDGDIVRLPKERRSKLTGRDYTASVMVEMLELSGKIDLRLYRLLEIARKARNAWAHEMNEPKQSEVSCCHQAIAALLLQVHGIQLPLQHGGRGGVPQWPIWLWEQHKPR